MMAEKFDRDAAFADAVARCTVMCEANGVVVPTFRDSTRLGYFGMYVPSRRAVLVHVARTRVPTRTPGFSWSYPGYKADLTVLGVTAHELGHHFDAMLRYPSSRSRWYIATSVTARVSSYEPSASESWAESFKLYVTNPSLLAEGRPERYEVIRSLVPSIVETRHWREVLADAHPRFHSAAERWIAQRPRRITHERRLRA